MLGKHTHREAQRHVQIPTQTMSLLGQKRLKHYNYGAQAPRREPPHIFFNKYTLNFFSIRAALTLARSEIKLSMYNISRQVETPQRAN